MSKTVGILTTTRAEYGILHPLIEKMMGDAYFDIKVLVSGTHLSDEYGATYREIENDNVPIAAKIDILSGEDSEVGVSNTMANAISRFAVYFSENILDALVVLGDRYETLAVCIAAMNAGIPIVHLHGGETTEGAIDECIRHSITKMSQLHLTATEDYRRRVIQLGEDPERAFNIGSIGVENVLNKELMSFEELRESLQVNKCSATGENRDKPGNPDECYVSLKKPYAVVTFHPVTLENNTAGAQIDELLNAISSVSDMDYIITLSNADAGGRVINEKIIEFAAGRENIHVFESLGALRYLSAVKYADMVIGNSSSGIIEVPSFGIPTINIGDRQKGRIQAESVINCEPVCSEIVSAINKARDAEFIDKCKAISNPYMQENSCKKAVECIKEYLQSEASLKKAFYDL